MITSVNAAFDRFMRDTVNLDKDVVEAAKSSRDNLLDNIAEFDTDDFFHLWKDINIQYGSFARKTKCRKLDDIDLMIGISADGATYDSNANWDNITITASCFNQKQLDCQNEDGTLNSTKVLNAFMKKLEKTKDYSRSELHKNGQAVTLTLLSREWNFDIVPCFHTVTEYDGRSYYLIPNGSGNWMKTNPEIDRNIVAQANQGKDGKLLDLIRLCKKWNKIKKVKTMPSYLLETMIVNYAENADELSDYIDVRFINVLKYLRNSILSPVYDMKQIQGNINSLSYEEKNNISQKAAQDYEKALEAFNAETKENNYKKAINLWRDVLGEEFPQYGD